MILTEVPLTEIPLTPFSAQQPVFSPQIAHTQLLAKLAVMLIAPDSASIAPQRTHFKFLITSPQMACYARLYFLTIPP